MKNKILTLILFVYSLATFAQEPTTTEKIDIIFKKYTGWFVDAIFYEIPFSENYKIPWVLIVLIGGAVYFTLYFKFINFTGFKTAIQVVRGKYEDIEKHGADTLYGDATPNTHEDIIETLRD